jgi:hypothetical protein
MENNTGSIQPNKRVLPPKKGWVVPCRDITTEGSSHGLGAYLDYNQDGDPFRVVISDIHNYPKWVHISVCLKCPNYSNVTKCMEWNHLHPQMMSKGVVGW